MGCYEFWSPNVSRIPPYPGIQPKGMILPTYFGLQLLDSSSSFLYTGFYPQILTNDTIIFAFLPVLAQNADNCPLSSYCKWVPLTSYLHHDFGAPGGGHIHISTEHINTLRFCADYAEHLHVNLQDQMQSAKIQVPSSYTQFLTLRDIDCAFTITLWEDTVDVISGLQFSLKLKLSLCYKFMGRWIDGISQKLPQHSHSGVNYCLLHSQLHQRCQIWAWWYRMAWTMETAGFSWSGRLCILSVFQSPFSPYCSNSICHVYEHRCTTAP